MRNKTVYLRGGRRPCRIFPCRILLIRKARSKKNLSNFRPLIRTSSGHKF